MFGYVIPLKCELKVREQTLYEAWYCGLCNTIRSRYGQRPRLALDYDCVFLALLLAGITGEGTICHAQRCGYKPLRAKKPVAQPCAALEYAADINILLCHAKLDDDWRDERSVLGLVGRAAFSAAAKRAKARRPEAAKAIADGIAALSQEELRGQTEIDAAADAFAQVLSSVFALYPGLEERQRRIAGWLGYHLGRWIYLMDAWDDRQKDSRSHAYNPFLAAGADEARASFLLYASLSEIEKAYDLLEISYAEGLLDNIVNLGCRVRTRQVLGGKAHESV